MATIKSRRGDGIVYETTRKEIVDDILAGAGDAVDCAGVPELSSEEVECIADIMCDPNRIVGVEPGHEVVMTEDGGPYKLMIDSGSSGNGIEVSRLQSILVHERALSMDAFQLAHIDYSIKAGKPIIGYEMQAMEQIQLMTVMPLLYGAMPNMGLYYAPDGPFGNPADLMREFKIVEARDQAEKAAHAIADDIEFVATKMDEAGSDGFNFDTTASAGDADFVGTLYGIERYKKRCPNAFVEMGMSAENVLGIHGEIEYNGKVVAGMYPHEQVKLAEEAGVNIFGAVVNTNTSRSSAWNIARAVTFVKEAERVSNIPIHVNQGMGVGGIPMLETPPADIVTRANKALVELAHVDGI